MPNWIKCGEDFITGDVVRWTEAVWPERKPRSKKKKPEKLGERRVTAAVVTVDSKGFVRLSVMKDEITANKYGMPLKPLKKDQVIVKKRVTVGRGGAERMKWSDESARAMAVSRFLS
jgi:hypothetical protein